ncbi:hypothetical protein N8766_05920, partial [bacterium]|nr:hypothetical protein [bacterium]
SIFQPEKFRLAFHSFCTRKKKANLTGIRSPNRLRGSLKQNPINDVRLSEEHLTVNRHAVRFMQEEMGFSPPTPLQWTAEPFCN